MHDKLVIGYPVLEGFIWCSCQRSRFASDYPSKLKSHIWETNWPILFIQHLLNPNPNPNVYTKFPIYIIYSFHTHLILIHCKLIFWSKLLLTWIRQRVSTTLLSLFLLSFFTFSICFYWKWKYVFHLILMIFLSGEIQLELTEKISYALKYQCYEQYPGAGVY